MSHGQLHSMVDSQFTHTESVKEPKMGIIGKGEERNSKLISCDQYIYTVQNFLNYSPFYTFF
jgi:hypothetical protein